MPDRRETPVTVKATSTGDDDDVRREMADRCSDPSIQTCPPCCPVTFKLIPELLAVTAPQAVVNGGSAAVEPVNGGAHGDGGISGTTILAIGAIAAAGFTAWWLYTR